MLRKNRPNIARPYRSPFGVFGALLTMLIAVVTLYMQVTGDAAYRQGVIYVAGWFVICILYFLFVGRHRLILSPEEEFALDKSGSGH